MSEPILMNSESETGFHSLDLRYMQVKVSKEAGANLPGAKLPETFRVCEFISLIEKTSEGMICFLKLEFDNAKILERKHGGFDILEIKSQTTHSALVKVIANGALTLLFCDMEDVWWVNPTFLHSNGMTLTMRGTSDALRTIRRKISDLITLGFSVKLGTESLQSPDFIDLLPNKQRIVLDKAIEMGYYDRPRGCTQRDIAKVMNIKQATVSEHLQSAESKIIYSINK